MTKKVFCILLTLLLLTTSALSQEQLFRIHINDFSGGQDSFNIPSVIGANQGVVVKNVILNRRGRLSKRKGLNLFAQDVSNTAFRGIGRFTPTATNDFLMIADDAGQVRRSTSTASWVIVNASDLLSIGKNVDFVQANKDLAILDGINYPHWYDGTTYTAGAAGSVSPPITRYGSWFKNYFFFAHGAVEKDWIWFSNNLEPRIWTDGDVFKVNTGDGQFIQALKPFKNNELVVYKERSVWVLDLAGVTPLVDWTLQPIIEDIGCIAPRSVATVGNDQWFLSSEPIGVRSLIRTTFDKIQTSLVSTPIQDIFDGTGTTVINETYIDEATAIFFDNKYIIAVPSGTATFNDLVLVYDLIAKAWYPIVGWFVEDWVVFDDNLYFIDSSDGRVMRAFSTSNVDQASGPVVTNDLASGPTARGIDFHYESKAFDFDSPELYKILDALEVITESSGDDTLEVFINKDGGGWQSIGTMDLGGESTNLPQDLPFVLSSEKLARKTFQMKRYGEFKEIQIGFDQSASDETVELRSYMPIGTKRKYRKE